MSAPDHRLTTREVAQFVAEGFLRFDALVPPEINERAIEEMRTLEPIKVGQALGKNTTGERLDRPRSLAPLSACYPPPSAIGEYLRLPRVRGIITSLVGADPTYDHDFVHFLAARSTYHQHLHVDAIVDSPDPTFDIQLFYFPHDVAPGAGGTRFVPGSHLRRTRAEGVARYQHIVGEQQYAGPAGTVLVFHHGLWHAGQANAGDVDRVMYKIRLNPTEPQVRLWNTVDLADLHNDPSDHVFALVDADTVAAVFRKMQPWQKGHEGRLELVKRTRLWRYLTGDDTYDADYYLTRIERRAKLALSV